MTLNDPKVKVLHFA